MLVISPLVIPLTFFHEKVVSCGQFFFIVHEKVCLFAAAYVGLTSGHLSLCKDSDHNF